MAPGEMSERAENINRHDANPAAPSDQQTAMPIQTHAIRPAKRQKAQQDGTTLVPTRLQKHAVLLPAPVSPGAVFGCRVAAQVSGDVDNRRLDCYLASGSHVYHVSTALEPVASVDMGKEGMALPRTSQDLAAHPMPGPAHTHEVQSISLHSTDTGRSWLGTVDNRGCAIIHHLAAPGQDQQHATEQHSANHEQQGSAAAVSNGQQGGPADAYALDASEGVHEAGWAGICMGGQAGTGGEVVAATAMHFMRRLCFYQGPRCVRVLHTLQPPTGVALLPSGAEGGPTAGLLACAEEHQVSLWDVRQGERAGLVQRLPVAAGGCPLHSLAWCGAQGGLLGAAGTERTVTLLDPRKWRVAHKWAAATKYAIHYLSFSRVAPSYCYVSGLDYECVVGRWDGGGGMTTGNANSTSGGHGRAVGPAAFLPQTGGALPVAEQQPATTSSSKGANISFRGDSRWLGMSAAAGCSSEADMVVASTQSGSLFVIETKAG